MAKTPDAPEQKTKKFQGVDRNEFAYKMLKNMGWEEGQGLGTDGNGITSHIKVKKMRDNIGVGANTGEFNKFNWTVNTMAFDSVLAGLNKEYGQEEEEGSAKKRKKDKASKKKDKDGKNKKNGKGKDSESDADEDDEEPPAKKKKVVASRGAKRGLPQGRYGKREQSKTVKNYSSGDLSAILGFAPSIMEKAELQAEKRGEAVSSAWFDNQQETEEAAAVQDPKKSKKDKKAGKATGERLVIEVPDKKEAELTKEEKEERAAAHAKAEAFFKLEADWWGCKVFRSGGRLGSIKEPAPEDSDAATKKGFSETDQEDLYNSTNNKSSQGRGGLGIRGREKKVAGARWNGQKMKYDSDEEEEGSPAKDEDTAGQELPATDSGIKWKKIVQNILKEEAGQSMKLKACQKAAVAVAQTKKQAAGMSKSELVEDMMSRMQDSSQFVVDKTTIALSSKKQGKK